MASIVLMGDSVFDNGAYTKGAPDVAEHLRRCLGAEHSVTLCAVDGTTTTTLGVQLGRVPKSTTQVVLSLGGNDGMENADLLGLPVRSTAGALDLFRERIGDFAERYGWALDAIVDLGHPVLVCTIYEGDLGDEAMRASTALSLFNDVIVRAAAARKLPLLDLRTVCNQPSDFVNAIEPSATGGEKVAVAVAEALEQLWAAPALRGHAVVFGAPRG